VVGGLPFGLALFIYLAAPTFFDPMFEKPPDIGGIPIGVILIGIAVLMMGTGFMAIRKIVDIEV
jgi:Flp pilus assembly protein TadB